MNAKLLFPATLALALASTVAYADGGKPVTRADVIAEYQRAAADGTLQRTDYDFEKAVRVFGPARNRADVIAEAKTAQTSNPLIGPMRNRTYNQYGTELLRPFTNDRAEVRADVYAAMRDGTMRQSELQDPPVRTVRGTFRAAKGPILAGARPVSTSR